MIYNNEISQKNNPNATARLFIQEDGVLFKKYFDFNDLTKKNIENLLAIKSTPRLNEIKELVLPLDIIEENGNVIGYTMPYYKGRLLLDYVNDDTISFASKVSCFEQLADVIMRLPSNIFVGDLHMKNVIVDANNKIHLIDIDGFSVQDANLLSCPLARVIQQDSRLQLDKYQQNGSVIVSRNTDILCFFDAFLYMILGKIYFTMYSSKCFLDYLDYLESLSFPKALLDDIQMLFTDEVNKITVCAFEKIDVKKVDQFSFQAYSNHLRTQPQ